MKTYEEKYKKALEWMREVYPTLQGAAKEDAEYVFPELKESEDEKIRIELLNYLYDVHDDDEERARWIAWLEKQGKNNMGISEATKKKLEDNLNKALEKETPESFNEFLDEQKPAWSEEDEIMINGITIDIEELIEQNAYDVTQLRKEIDWLTSLKDRIQPQQRQEWNEEDERMYKAISIALTRPDAEAYLGSWYKTPKDADAWLKSLRPQNTWKPSEEQMADLWNMVCECRPSDLQLLQDIYYGLKTLRGE